MQSLARILAAFQPRDGAYMAAVDSTWMQGRTAFGGLIATLANRAMRQLVPADRPLRALQAVFIGPIPEGEAVFTPTVSRVGKAVTLTRCTAHSGGEVSMTVTAMYGAGRESVLNIKPPAQRCEVAPNDAKEKPYKEGSGLPTFLQHYQQRWARGARLFSQATDARMSVYLRYRNEDVARTTEAHALALMDAIPSPALALMDKPSPASTLSWTLELLDTQFDFGIDEWWRLDADVDAAAEGYVVHSSQVVNPAGRIAAISRQVVTVYG